ncbi:MAG: zinc ABC transporter substrate-binding protein [Nocardioides sp.]
MTIANRPPTMPILVGLTALAALSLTGCGSTSSGGATPTDGGGGGAGGGAVTGTVSVVASTNVWGDVVRQVAGSLADRRVQITSIISNPDADPHSYEASTQNLLALSNARVVVENGGGYDDFVATMLKSSHNTSATVLDAVAISGKQPDADGDLNEHVWYDFPTVHAVAGRIEQALSAADPTNAVTYRNNLRVFDAKLTAMEHTESEIKAADGGEGVAITEPVPLYMLQACGLVNRTPEPFSKAVEEGTDVSPSVLKQTEDLFSHGEVDLLAYNEQTTGAETQAVLNAAKAGHVAVVPVTETLPAGQNYVSWMRGNLAAIRHALG